jgi:hypothetical protein
MASTYSSSLRIQLIETGTENEAWGQPLDNNLGTVIEQAIVGSNTISLTNLTSYTLTAANASPDQARNAVLVFDGALSADCNVIAPSVKKVYVVSNKTSGGYLVNIKTSSGNAVSVINGTNQLVYCDSTDFKTAVNINTIIGDLAVSGNATVNGSVTIGGNISGPNNLASTNGNITTVSNTSIVQLGNNTGAFVLPTGNTVQRPSTVKLGMQRWNTDLTWVEVWNGVVWYPLTGSYGVQYLVVAGGGAGGGAGGFGNAGGGGGGGALVGGITVQSGTAYTITIGAGGASFAAQGANTFALGFTAVGGGGGGNNAGNGGNGGSGGGAGRGNDGVAKTGGSATTGQGFAGGNTDGSTGSAYGAAGGGGGGTVGQNGQTFGGGAGGSGVSTSISGSLVTYAGGGGGAGGDNGGSGGAGGGGAGGAGGSPNGQPGTANRGGGGGGIAVSGVQTNFGGSGIAIISYASPTQTATGGTVTSYTSGGTLYWVHTFTTSGTFTA